MAGEKTEKATPKRKQDERKKGNVFLSREVVTITSLLAAFASLEFLFPLIFSTIESNLKTYLSLGATVSEITKEDITPLFIEGCIVFAKAAMPLLCIGILVQIVVTMAQTKMMFSGKAFSFKGERLDPMKGLKKMVSMRSFVELLKSVLKITVLIYIIAAILKDELYNFPRMMDMEPLQVMAYTGEMIMKIATRSGIIFIFLTAGDYLYQWWEYEKNLRMSKQEIKDEYKQMEGDPQVKAQIRAIQQQRARQRMMQNVPNADVIIRNPTHYAIAIQYDQTKHHAPIVIAKGADAVALRIIAVGEDAGVYIVENRPLARSLFETVDLDREVPTEFYQAIAEVLAFVNSLKKKGLN